MSRPASGHSSHWYVLAHVGGPLVDQAMLVSVRPGRRTPPRPRLRGDRAGGQADCLLAAPDAGDIDAHPASPAVVVGFAHRSLAAEGLVFEADRHAADGRRAVASGAAEDTGDAPGGARFRAEAAAVEATRSLAARELLRTPAGLLSGIAYALSALALSAFGAGLTRVALGGARLLFFFNEAASTETQTTEQAGQ